jgi:hypothetical protein
MTPDDVSKNTTPNAIRDATNEQLDERYNFAVGHLRGTDEGLLRQTQTSIRAILDEVARRRGKSAWKLSLISACFAVVSPVTAILSFLDSHSARRSADRQIKALSQRITALETAMPKAPIATPRKAP